MRASQRRHERQEAMMRPVVQFIINLILMAIRLAQVFLGAILAALVLPFSAQPSSRPKRVAVIGGGIAGFGSAWALSRSGSTVDVFEASAEMGGNAKTFEWPDGVVTGLSVLAWPKNYFRNYKALLRTLKLQTTSVRLPFYIRRRDGESFAHGRKLQLSIRYARDMQRWARMVEFVRRVNRFFNGSSTLSLYHLNMLNPMNLIPLRILMLTFGMSRGFFLDVIVPLYGSTFLTTMGTSSVPAVMIPLIDDIISVGHVPELETWDGSSRAVFAGMAASGGGGGGGGSGDSASDAKGTSAELRVRLGSKVEQVHQQADGSWTVEVRTEPLAAAGTEQGSTSSYAGYDAVVFASNAAHASSALPRSLGWLAAKLLLGAVDYVDSTDPSFRRGIIHTDASVLPADIRASVLDEFANYVVAHGNAAPPAVKVLPRRELCRHVSDRSPARSAFHGQA